MAYFLQQRAQIDLIRVEVKLRAVIDQARGIEQIVDHGGHLQDGPANLLCALDDRADRHAVADLGEALGLSINDRQRSTEFM
jgi:hypothetical protein